MKHKKKGSGKKAGREKIFLADRFSGPDKDFGLEQLRSLRTQILFPSGGREFSTIGVTSAATGEGKTFIASNLGYFLSQNVDGKQTLLVDADLRLPSLHQPLGLPGEPGLSEFLSRDLDLSELLLDTEYPNLALLPGGRAPANPTELLSSNKMLNLLATLESEREDRYVVIDLPSPKLAPESAVLSRKLDGLIVVARAGKTPQDQVRNLIDFLGREKVIGVVLNGFDTSFHSSLYRIYRRFAQRR